MAAPLKEERSASSCLPYDLMTPNPTEELGMPRECNHAWSAVAMSSHPPHATAASRKKPQVWSVEGAGVCRLTGETAPHTAQWALQ
jgi:hypothetical protein